MELCNCHDLTAFASFDLSNEVPLLSPEQTFSIKLSLNSSPPQSDGSHNRRDCYGAFFEAKSEQ
jgi:hypothetical protein